MTIRSAGRRHSLSLILGLLAALAVPGLAPATTVRVGIVSGADEVGVGRRGRELMLQLGEGSGARPAPGVVRLSATQGTAPAPAAAEKYVVRVRTEKDRRKAELVEKGLRDALKVPLRIEKGGAGWTIVAGPFESQKKAEGIRDELRGAGMTEANVVTLEAEAPAAAAGPRIVAITGAYDVLRGTGDQAIVSAADGEPLELDGRLYRGELEVSVDAAGRLTVVNIVDVEDYLRGVVPEEMGPELYPMPAALEAQAVAARTYALRVKQHEGEGFDCCATAHCQVYGGASSEHPLSDAAVRATAGRVLLHDGKLAMTYFSSTCGGHTENVADIFAGTSEPYLRGVDCYPEQVAFRRVQGRRVVADWLLVSGLPADQTLARLVAAGVVTDSEGQAGGFGRRVTKEEAAEWLRRASVAAGASLQSEALAGLDSESAMSFLRTLMTALGWTEQRRLIAPQDVAAARRFRELQGLTEDELPDALLALKNGILPSGLQPGWPSIRLSRGNVLEILSLWLEGRGRFDSVPVRYVGGTDKTLSVLVNKQVTALPLAGQPVTLAGRRSGTTRVRDSLDLKLGDKLWVMKDGSGAAVLLSLEEDADGAAFDRSSAYSWWTRRIAGDQLARDAAAKEGVTGLRDVRVTRVSAGGRIVGLELVGAGGSKTVSGFAVRGLLGLPDLRATLQVERDSQGRLAGLVATGRGWGHGVGLCQTGAHGMALAGADAGAILTHYYPGTVLSAGR